ncbi:MAG: NAD-binding protein [Anaerolineae bacterium]
MDSFKESQRQIRIAILVVGIIIPIGVIGFMLFERFSLLDAIWLTVITLATIGYGDIYARTEGGRIFTVFLILFGLGGVAYGLQATATFFLSPAIRDLRQRRRTQHTIDHLRNHYIICGTGQLVDITIHTLIDIAKRRQQRQLKIIDEPIDNFLGKLFGTQQSGLSPLPRRILRGILTFFPRLFRRSETILDVIVVVTPDTDFANHVREMDLLVIEGDPTNDAVLRRAGLEQADAMMVMLENDTEGLLTVLAARNLNREIGITAAAVEDEIATKMIRVGANEVIAHYELAGRFLNNATLRPAVNEFFTGILFSQNTDVIMTQLHLWEDSQWVGQQLGTLHLRSRFHADLIGLRREDGTFSYVPGDEYVLSEGEILIVVLPARFVPAIEQAYFGSTGSNSHKSHWQRLMMPSKPPLTSSKVYELDEAEQVIKTMSGHFVICGTGRVARNAISNLDPARPFVIISDDSTFTKYLVEKGFRVVEGNLSQEATLLKAGVNRALACMIAIDDDALSVLTILNCRSLSKRLLITTTAQSDEMIPKLHRAGADRVLTPYQIAAQFIILATTRPAISDFLQYVLYNYQAAIETTELYMQDDSPWIGKSISELELRSTYDAGVIGIRTSDGRYHYAPPVERIMQPHEVMIVVTPMKHSDTLREQAHGSLARRPLSLRRNYEE